MKRLDSRHHIAIKYLALPGHGGLTMQQIAEKATVSRKTLYEWSKEELFERELKKEMKRVVGNEIPDVLRALLNAATTEGNAKAAELLLKTYGGMLTDNVEIEHKASVYDRLDVEEIRKRAEDIKERRNREVRAAKESGEAEKQDEN